MNEHNKSNKEQFNKDVDKFIKHVKNTMKEEYSYIFHLKRINNSISYSNSYIDEPEGFIKFYPENPLQIIYEQILDNFSSEFVEGYCTRSDGNNSIMFMSTNNRYYITISSDNELDKKWINDKIDEIDGKHKKK